MAQNMSGSPHRTRRKDNMAQQGLRDGGGYSRGNVGGKSSNPSKSSSLASKSDKAHKREHFTNGGSSGSSGSHEIKVSRNPQAYSSAVSRFADSDREDRDGPSDRTHYIAMNLIGQQVRAILKDGTVYEGIFHNPIFDRGFGVVLHMARKKESSDSGVVQTPPIDQVTVQPQDLVMIDAPEVAFVEDSAEFKKQMMREGGFRTDTEISGRDFSERELVPWSAPIDEEGGLGGLEEDQGARNRWDQFEANERLFGVRTTYDERVYTTEIDRQRVTREVVEKAIRIEREIKLQTTSNIHLAEERGIVAPKDDTEDEEDKYSSVLREQKGPGPKFGASQAQKGGAGGAYVVPAKRKGEAEAAAAAAAAEPRDGGNNKAREHEFRKLRQREQEIEREREREREKEKEREKARQRERERIDRERAAKGLAPSSPATGSRASSSSSPTSASAAALSSGLSRSTTSIANLADETHKAPPSPSLPSKLTNSPFRQRSFSMSNIGAAVDESGAANPDPEDPQYLEKLRVQKLLTEMRAQGIDPRAAAERLKEPFHSPIVGRPEQLKSLDLSPAVPRVPESVLQEFQQYKEQRKRSLSTTSPAVPTKQDMVNFSKEIEKKTSTPNSPALRARRGDHNHNPIMPSPLSPRHVLDATAAKLEKEGSSTTTTTTTKPSGPSASSSTSSSAVPTPAAAETPATTPATLATPVAESPASASAATSPRKESAPTASATPATAASSEASTAGGDATTADGQVPLSKIQLPSLKSKLNPFAKAFTPKRPAPTTAAAPPASAPNASSMAATLLSAAAAAGAGDKSAKPTVDVNIPVSSFFAQGMRRLQDNPEDPEQVAPVWPYGRVPYRQEEAGIPMEGYYAPVPNMSLPPQGRHMGYPPVPYVTSPPPQMGSAQPVMLFPPGQPVPRGFVPQGSIPGPAYYPGGPGGAGPYPPHLYSAPPNAVPTPAGGPMGHKGRMGPPYPGAPPPHGHGVVPPPHSPHAPPHSPQGTPPRGGQAATAPAGYPPNSPTAFGVVPPPDHGVVPPPHSPHAPTAAPHSPHAPRAGGGPHMVPGPGQGQPPLYTFPPPGAPHLLGDPAALAGVPPSMVVPGPGMAPPPRGAGGYRGYGQQPPPQMAQQQQQGQQQQQQQQRPDGGKSSSTAAAVQAQPFHPRGGQGSAININAGAFYPGQQRGGGQPAARGGPQQQQQDNKEQRFKVPNTDVLPHQ